MPHVDMLHHARRLWHRRRRGPSPQQPRVVLLGHEREGDVPGFEIPSRYFHYVRTGDARPLGAVLEHNRRDLLSLALLTARAAQLLDEGVTAATTAREALGIGGCTSVGHDLGCIGLLCESRGDGRGVCAEALTRTLCCCAVSRRYDDAADAWQRLLELGGCPPRLEARSCRSAGRAPRAPTSRACSRRDAWRCGRFTGCDDARGARPPRIDSRASIASWRASRPHAALF